MFIGFLRIPGSELNSDFLLFCFVFCFVFLVFGGPGGGFGGFLLSSRSSGFATTFTTT